MAKSKRMKYYAVRKGREGAHIYTSWVKTKENVSRWPGASHKSFKTLSEAEDWLAAAPIILDEPEDDPMEGCMPSTATHGSRQRNVTPTASDHASISTSPSGNNSQVEFVLKPKEIVILSPEQSDVLEMVKEGKSVFFTGSAGTGKSVLLREIIAYCGGPRSETLAVTAATGIASVNIGGSTVHSWAGIGLGKESAQKLAGKLLGLDKLQRRKEKERLKQGLRRGASDDENIQTLHSFMAEQSQNLPRVVERWRRVQTLIIDEISMIDGLLFDKLEYIARVLRDNELPFGGIQLVLSGDFCQLPPVPDRINGVPQAATFAFDALTWNRCVGKPIVLHRVFRQKDQAFVDMLNEMRFGRLSPVTTSEFKKLSRPVIYDDGIEPTDLFPTRSEVETANMSRLNKLDGPAHKYRARDIPGSDVTGMPISQQKMDTILDRLIAPKEIILKVGAQVMLIKNLVQGQLVNGSVGRVVDFSTTRDALKKGMEVARTEGRKEDNVEKHIPYEILNGNHVWPIVKFGGGSTMLCIPSSFEVNNVEGMVEARRDQVPLILAWALSIHKSQGQTLERVRVDLGRIFEKGQAYVALSRATSMESLQVLRFDAARVVAHTRVLEWMKEATGIEYRTPEEIEDDMVYWDVV